LYFLPDHLSSTASLTSANGGLIEQASYEAFGANGGSALTRYGYTGRERDEVTGLLYYRARWYDAAQGRFLSEDPAGLAAGVNLYAYVLSDPLRHSDPFGLDRAGCIQSAIKTGAKSGAVGGAVVGGTAGAVGIIGGPTVVVTVGGGAVGGAAAGGVVGGWIGAGIGWVFCPDDSTSPGNPVQPIPMPPFPITANPAIPDAMAKGKDRCRPDPENGNDKWTCIAKCNIQNYSNVPNAPPTVEAVASGPTRAAACQNAMDLAVAKAPRGTYARHPHCTRCWRR
jgi:RHS repeat-associated protein